MDPTMIIILAVLFVGMIAMTIIPNRKRKKQQEQMMSSLGIGTKIMTIGRLIGTIVAINNAENQLIINVGSEENPTLITIDKMAVGMVVNPVGAAPAPDINVEDDTAATDTDESANI